jgi:ribonuclease E
MAKRMLIDANHPEETRVVVLAGQRLEEFDIEAASRKPLKGNIYLAKVTRVEPSLQAAFVDYGGNRHGFLPFSEIHPDYYRIPIADREALIAEESDEDEVSAEPEQEGEAEEAAAPAGAESESEDKAENGQGDGEEVEQVETESSVDTLDGDEAEDAARRRSALLRKYKIQEVIKRRQVILVQVTKEERGNKGAALTTYLSLAGRYCVLMPNTPRGGGISRKIASAQDRKRLKSVLSELDIPDGIAVIVRTAGSQRTKAEIKRDYEYLMRLWSEIREKTLESTAPSLIHEEGDLIKRSLRDLYARDMDEILVEGDEAYKAAKTFMKQLTPSHARKVKQYKDERIPLFHRFQVENQLDAIHTPVVHMKSGGYIVLNQTEALVAIDVNSGRATKERHIEETALKTNLEAAEEVARQLRLRDLAGLVVVDFIDMDESRHNREVERRFKEAMKSDRARIQLGRISPFGLLEMSRQRLRPSLVETSTEICQHCGGTGRVRSIESTALSMLRLLEEEGIKRGAGQIILTVPTAVALFVLNQKRDHLAAIEQRHGIRAMIQADERLTAPDYRIQRHDLANGEQGLPPAVITAYESVEDEEDEAEVREVRESREDREEGGSRRRRSKRGGRNRRRGDRDERPREAQESAEETSQEEAAEEQEDEQQDR